MANGNQGLIKRWAHRWFIDGLGFMAQGLFASLIIGLIISQLSLIPDWASGPVFYRAGSQLSGGGRRHRRGHRLRAKG